MPDVSLKQSQAVQDAPRWEGSNLRMRAVHAAVVDMIGNVGCCAQPVILPPALVRKGLVAALPPSPRMRRTYLHNIAASP